jgi:hypothetical protein
MRTRLAAKGVRDKRTFRRTGPPIVHLWECERNLLAIGLSPYGVRGIYFARKCPIRAGVYASYQ